MSNTFLLSPHFQKGSEAFFVPRDLCALRDTRKLPLSFSFKAILKRNSPCTFFSAKTLYVHASERTQCNPGITFWRFPVPQKWVDAGYVKDCVTASMNHTMHSRLFFHCFSRRNPPSWDLKYVRNSKKKRARTSEIKFEQVGTDRRRVSLVGKEHKK